jgi:hypothetical protein
MYWKRKKERATIFYFPIPVVKLENFIFLDNEGK